MTLNARKVKKLSNKNRAPVIEEGIYPGRTVIIAAIGLQDQGEYNGEKRDPNYSLLVTYELSDEFMPDEDGNDDETKPRWFSEQFVLHHLDSDLAKSTKRYYALDPKEEHKGDWTQLINMPVNISIGARQDTNDKDVIWNNVLGIAAMRPKDKDKTPDLVNEPVVFDSSEPDMEMFYKMPKWMQGKCKEALDFEGSVLQKAIENNPRPSKDDDAPKKSPNKDIVEEDEEDEDW